MKNPLRSVVHAVLLAGALVSVTQAGPPSGTPSPSALIEGYCQECHNATDWAGGLALDVMDLDDIPADAKVWETVVRKLRGHLMPPPTHKQPDQASVDQVVAFVENRIDAKAAEHPSPGFVSLHRLNRTEYERAVQDILGLQFDASALLPKDVRNEGFDNVANVLKVSPSFLDQYLWAAREVSVQAVGDPKSARASAIYRAGGEDQRLHVPGLPLGTRGGFVATHVFPVDGEYTFNLNPGAGGRARVNYFPFDTADATPTVLLIDGVPVWDSSQVPPEERKGQGIRLRVSAGAHKVALTMPAGSLTENDDQLRPLSPAGGGAFRAAPPALEIVAPATAGANGLPDTPSRQKIFVCRPAAAAEEEPCARRILGRIAREAYRRPVNDQDLGPSLRFYDKARKSGGDFDTGIQQGIMAILASPKFLYRAEQMPANLAPGQSYRINDLELASRLAFFLWSRGPDEELLGLAEAGRLHEPAVLAAQVRRLLADERSRSLVTNFAFQWLVVDKADEVMPDQGAFPEFDASLRSAMKQEVELFIDSVLRSDQSVMALLTADYTFLNERLALHYGRTDVRGNEFRRVVWKDPNRFGLLGKANVLMATSYGDRTSPVVRGSWILENLIGTPPTPPPPGVEALKDGVRPGARPLTVRERLEIHRSQPSCNSCHGVMDPLGLALENFDAVGKWRDVDRASLSPIDASDKLASGQRVRGPVDLRAALTARPDQFVQTLTEKLMVFALGRTLDHRDMPTVRAIVRGAAKDDYRFETIVRSVVASDAFQMRQIPEVAPEEGAKSPLKTARNAPAPSPASVNP